ncbi:MULTISPECIES: dephospho-CoA kinase [unclassified Coleofasciculus]|uniref:dephospho-CoA kinase n=1 Tax=unclassified Coleofasciculus TaxID=2692782 RepID=UPI00187F2458|nr:MULTISPECIES: dephospho-CoA kinase [unclassified Coleofasciculus]MBE9127171.1 dephospho-CoA kinase [Coleofasciculus sp. LEGE 07081]MBE9150492.1 dephospho-CoA kinase [Coleofasciculus sp. LEGE 07092]
MKELKKRIIGLTGGIGTGKTTVSNYLADTYQLPILDADIYAREAVEPGSQILNQIFKRYGVNVRLPDGTLNRQRLGEIIFNYPTERQWVEQQIHPYVRDRFQVELSTIDSATAILVVPLLFEAGMTNLVTEIWVVSCSPEQQIERMIERDRLSPEQAKTRLDNQLPMPEKIVRADVVLDNASTLNHLLKQVDDALTGSRGNI